MDYEALKNITRLKPDFPFYSEIMERHCDAINKGEETYIDPATGYIVLTAAYLFERGYCCGSGCRHCPYEK